MKGGEWHWKQSRKGACSAWNDGKCVAQRCQHDLACLKYYGDYLSAFMCNCIKK